MSQALYGFLNQNSALVLLSHTVEHTIGLLLMPRRKRHKSHTLEFFACTPILSTGHPHAKDNKLGTRKLMITYVIYVLSKLLSGDLDGIPHFTRAPQILFYGPFCGCYVMKQLALSEMIQGPHLHQTYWLHQQVFLYSTGTFPDGQDKRNHFFPLIYYPDHYFHYTVAENGKSPNILVCYAASSDDLMNLVEFVNEHEFRVCVMGVERKAALADRTAFVHSLLKSIIDITKY